MLKPMLLVLTGALALPVASFAQPSPRSDRPFNGEFVSMREGFEHYPLNEQFIFGGFAAPPESFNGPSGFEWGMNRLTGQTGAGEWARIIDLSGAPLGGANGVINASRVMRLQTLAAQQPNIFYAGARLRWDHPLNPTADDASRVSSEVFVVDAANTTTFRVGSVSAGTIGSVIIWGGTCSSENNHGYCGDLLLPEGPIPGIQMLIVNLDFAWGPYIYRPSRYCTDARGEVIPGCTPPAGASVGDPVALPLGAWVRMSHETADDGRRTLYMDLLDGGGEVAVNGDSLPIFQAPEAGYTDFVEWGSSYESVGVSLYLDNVEASGALYVPPPAPPADCPLTDDFDWMDLGIASVQAGEWQFTNYFVTAQDEPGRGLVLVQPNRVDVVQYRREFSRMLERADLVGGDLVVSFDAATDDPTVRAFSIFDGDDLAARVTLGLWPFDAFEIEYDPSVFVQINPDYDPINPVSFESPVIGVDMADTGADWVDDEQYRRIEMRLSNNGSVRVSIDGQRVYAGAGGFTSGADLLAFECGNNRYGGGSELRLDVLAVDCEAPSCATDFDFDDTTTFADLNAVLSNFGQTGLAGFHPGDANADGEVNFADLNAVLSAFGASCD